MASHDPGPGSGDSGYRPPADDETLLAQLRDAFKDFDTGKAMPETPAGDDGPDDAEPGGAGA